MPAGLPVAIFVLAQAAGAAPADPAPVAVPTTAASPTYGPPAPPRPKPPPSKAPEASCASVVASANPREIIVCAPKPQGYRLNPDVLQARREIRSGGRPTRPGPGGFKDNPRCVVGPEGCHYGGINLIGAALTAAEMASRLAKGKEIGSMFVTDPHPSEYQLYLEAKHRREAAESEKAAKAKAKAKSAVAPANTETLPAQ